MSDLNSVVLIGRITADTKLDYTPSGTAYVKFSLAVNKSRKNQDGTWNNEANFFDVTLWGEYAKVKQPSLTKGRQIAVIGELHQDRWEKDGRKNSRVGIVASSVQLFKTESTTQSVPGGAQQQFSGEGFPDDIPF